MEELCRDAPHLADRLREWTRVLKSVDWMCRRADEVADETLGEAGTLTAEEKDRHRTLGEYTLLEELGGGGMGRVFKAIHRKMNRTVAVKLLPESLVQSPESVERFRREVQALARLSHPNIVAVHDAGAADGTHFYVMDLVDGEDLARLVKGARTDARRAGTGLHPPGGSGSGICPCPRRRPPGHQAVEPHPRPRRHGEDTRPWASPGSSRCPSKPPTTT